jgi:phosphopantetheine--protein transferase-like protein
VVQQAFTVTLADILRAQQRLVGGVLDTPVLRSATLDLLAGAELFFKCEHQQVTGSFKARGALNAVLSLTEAQARQGVATHSSGNHGAALAWAAASRGLPAYIVDLAKRFAAKEAIAKALGTGIGHGVSFQDMIITNNAKGAPEVVLSGGAARIMAEQGAHKVLLSLADERHYAIAYAILLGS